jgi:hypothetical protein
MRSDAGDYGARAAHRQLSIHHFKKPAKDTRDNLIRLGEFLHYRQCTKPYPSAGYSARYQVIFERLNAR